MCAKNTCFEELLDCANTCFQEVLVRLELASYIVWSTLMLSYTLLSCVAQRSSDRFTHVYLDRGTALFVIILGHLSWAVGSGVCARHLTEVTPALTPKHLR